MCDEFLRKRIVRAENIGNIKRCSLHYYLIKLKIYKKFEAIFMFVQAVIDSVASVYGCC